MDEFITIARIVKSRGLKGEVSAEVLTDFPERFQKVTEVRILRGDEVFREELAAYRFHGGRVLLKFVGLEEPQSVERLIPGEVQVPAGEAVQLPPGSFFHFQLIGCEVREGKKVLGQVTDILESGGNTNLIIAGTSGGEFLIPLARSFVKQVDLDRDLIRVELPPGLLELERKPGRKMKRSGKSKAGK